MKKPTKRLFSLLGILPLMVCMAGCTATTRTVSPEEQLAYDATYTFSDKKKIVHDLVESLRTQPPLGSTSDRPVIIVYGIANRTSEHIDTSGITDEIRKEILQTGKARFVNKSQRQNILAETDYQMGGAVAPETRIALARQVGAKYMLTGTLRSIEKEAPKQIRLKKKSYIYYSLNLELTSIETSLIEWADSVELVREASKPIIGW
ncbi:penicillin-binding protein activator LpoB [Desulfosarcina widdelii]|uniref:Penicillin-binding protein activator LpoB n=1 Tax=Desulfosarcina widdelii TaxID=947919 RepID=A0A5K7ZBX9_9BACT|nr:penicillin-binding protein activator LpoB [Desulfosarcina widdelii]BBO78320.1 penicillin-binding protein activator LpoB [Desulfosarcina widdelii]